MMGSRVGPPTRMTASRSCAVIFALCSASSQTLKVRCTRSITILLNSASLSVAARSITLPAGSWQMPSTWILETPSRPTSILARSEASGEPGHDAVVEVVAAQVGIARGGEDLEDVLADLEDGDVEGAATEVVDRDLLRDVLSESVRERGGGRLVEDAEHVQPGDPAGVLGRLPLVVVEVGGDGDDRLLHLVPDVVLDDRLHLLEHQGGDLGERVDVLPDLDTYGVVLAFDDLVRHHRLRLLHLVGEVEAADQALGAVHRVVGVGDDVALGAVAD